MDLMLALAGVILGVLALVIGFYHVLEIKRVHGAMSTQYVGEFPEFMDQIIAIINGARHELVVFCDFPGYAKFSTPGKASEYQNALEQARLREGVTLDVTCLSSSKRAQYRTEQFPNKSWPGWLKEKGHDELLANYMAAAGWTSSETPGVDDLRAALNKADDHILEHPVFRKAHQVDMHMPIYCWIADKRHAVFSIPTLSHTAVEQGFLTSDLALIRGLLEMHQRYTK